MYLAQTGRKVTVVEMLPRTCASPDDKETSERFAAFGGMVVGDPLVHGIAIRELLIAHPELDMKILTSTKALEISGAGVRVEGPEGVYTVEADTVVYAVGQRPLAEEAETLRDSAPEFYMLGDCVTPKNIFAATQAAYTIARDIGRV